MDRQSLDVDARVMQLREQRTCSRTPCTTQEPSRHAGVPVDARVSRGRTTRDALRRLLGTESVDRIIVSASDGTNGLSLDDLRWLLECVPAEVLVLRPAPDDTRRIAARELNGHF